MTSPEDGPALHRSATTARSASVAGGPRSDTSLPCTTPHVASDAVASPRRPSIHTGAASSHLSTEARSATVASAAAARSTARPSMTTVSGTRCVEIRARSRVVVVVMLG
ncbi:MAG: hypothetical protein WKF58_06440 [Ilumatobacteraceae bacterium]